MRPTIKITLVPLLLFECILEYNHRSNVTTAKGSKPGPDALSDRKPNSGKDGEKKEGKDRWNEKSGSKPPDPCPKNEYRPCPWNYDHICWCEHNCDNSWTLCKDAGPYSDKSNTKEIRKAPDPCPKKEYRPCPWNTNHICWCDHNCDDSWTLCKDAGPF